MGFFNRTPPPSRLSGDHELMRQAMAYVDPLYGLALRLTRSPNDAEDLVQDTLLRAHRFSENFESGTNLKAWLFKILTNTFINKYRRGQRERAVLDGHDADPVGDGVMSRSAIRNLFEPETAADQRLLAEEIQKALELLPEDYRLMVMLADVEELSYKEIADIVGCPIGTVMSRLHRARKLLQRSLMGQAIAMGLVDASAAVAVGRTAEPAVEQDEPVSIDAFRRRKEGGR